MDDKLKCFICQSKSKSKSADGSSSEKRRKKDNNYTNLDSSTWRIFCHYFYPPPLIGLLDSSSSSLNSPTPENEDFSRPVFCVVCYQTIVNLCNLHNQLELIQSQISKIVAQVSLVFVQEKESHDQNKGGRQCKRKKKEQQHCDDDVIYSMRRCIRQRYHPSVCITKANLGIPNQNGGGSSTFHNGMEIDEQFSPLSIHSNNLDLDLDFDVDFSRPIKQEVEDSINDCIDNEEYLNVHANMANNPHLPAEEKDSEKTLKNPKRKRKIKPKSIYSNYEEDGSHGNQNEDCKGDSDYEPDHDSDSKLVTKKNKSTKDKKVAIPKTKRSRNSPRGPYKKRIDLLKPTIDPKVGENIYEYAGQWRYEKKLDESGNLGFYCMTCPKVYVRRYLVIRHINHRHNDETRLRGQRTRRIDDDNFTYDEIYTIQRVTKPNGIFFKCGSCGALRKTIEILKSHLREIHIEPKKWVCEQCGFSCPTKSRLELHMESHEDVKKYVCDECGKLLKTKRELQAHKEGHRTTRFLCYCGKAFRYSKGLREHRKTVNHPAPNVGPTPDEPFVPKTCPQCQRVFVTQEKFQKHTTVCQGGVKTPCDWCGGLYRQPEIHKRRACKERFNRQNSGSNNTNNGVTNLHFESKNQGQDGGKEKETEDPFQESILS